MSTVVRSFSNNFVAKKCESYVIVFHSLHIFSNYQVSLKYQFIEWFNIIIAMFWIFELHNSYSTRKLNKSTLKVTTKMLNTISCWEEFKTISFHQSKNVGNQLRREIYSRSFSTNLFLSKNGRLYSGHFLKPILFDNFLLGRVHMEM